MTKRTETFEKSPWELLRLGRFEEDLAPIQEAYKRDPNASHVMELGVAYLWTERYDASLEHFQRAIQADPFTMGLFFCMAGVSEWCLGEREAALKSWRLGLNVQFADAAGGLSAPLLLWLASVTSLDDDLKGEAIRLLEARTRDPRVKNWPGAIAQFILGSIDERELEERSVPGRFRTSMSCRKWRRTFYKHALELDQGIIGRKDFGQSMQLMTDTSLAEWSDTNDFLQLLWSAEFFIARHEMFLHSQQAAVDLRK